MALPGNIAGMHSRLKGLPGDKVVWARTARGIGSSALLLLALATLGICPASGQDARGLLQRTLTAYQKLSSLESRTNIDTYFLVDGKPLPQVLQSLSITMLVKRPNKLRLEFSAPVGNREVCSDGATLVIYDGASRQYTREPAALTLAAMLPTLATEARIEARMDPLDLFIRGTLPDNLTGLKKKGTALVNGRPTRIVAGVLRGMPQVQRQKNGGDYLIPGTQYWTWWIDKDTDLLAKVEQSIPHIIVTTSAGQGARAVKRTLTVTRLIRYVVAEVVPNGANTDRAFTFIPPSGATERKRLSALLREGK